MATTVVGGGIEPCTLRVNVFADVPVTLIYSIWPYPVAPGGRQLSVRIDQLPQIVRSSCSVPRLLTSTRHDGEPPLSMFAGASEKSSLL